MEPQDRHPAFDEARRRRATLHDQLVHVEQAISSPAAGRMDAWTAQVVKELVGLRDAFEQHVLVTEKPDGLYEEIITRAPRLSGAVHKLGEQHPAITGSISERLSRVEAMQAGTETWAIDDCRDDLQRMLGLIVRHRQQGADLVWEAYNLDIGGPE